MTQYQAYVARKTDRRFHPRNANNRPILPLALAAACMLASLILYICQPSGDGSIYGSMGFFVLGLLCLVTSR